MKDIPIENPNKYGAFDDDATELADILNGNEPRRSSSPQRGPAIPATSAVDEDFFSQTRDSNRKYGA